MRKYLPFTIAKSFKNGYVNHCVADFETCFTNESKTNVRVWAWGMLDILTGEYDEGTDIQTWFDRILKDKLVYDIGFHNLKFDGTFIIPQLFKKGYKYLPNHIFMEKWENGDDMTGLFTHNITAMGQWFSITIVKNKNVNRSTPAFVHIWDTYKLFPVSLEKLGVQYNTKTQKIKEDREFYERIRPENHVLTNEEHEYLKADCEVIALALREQLDKYGTIYRTQASKAFTFFKEACTDEVGNNVYERNYEGLKQWIVPEIKGFEEYKGAKIRTLPRDVKAGINATGVKLGKDKDYYIPDYQTWLDIKRSYFGGISYVNPEYAERSIVAPITVLDVNSMYPYCLRTYPIPYGRFERIEGAPDPSKSGCWIACARVSFKLKKPTNLPCIQMRDKYGRNWLRESTDYKKYGEMDPYNEDVIYFNSVDFETFQENYDFTVHKWLYHYWFPNMAYKDGRTFIDRFYAEKQNADNIMTAIKQQRPDDFADDIEFQRASFDRQESKVMMNSAYGKHGTKYFLYAKDSEYHGENEPVKYVPETKLSRNPDKDPSHYYCPYASFVTAYARQMLVRCWNAFEGRGLYVDTDSCHFLGTPDDIPDTVAVDVEKTGALGLWKVENEFDKARYLRPKSYIEINAKETNIVCAGATKEIKELMDWDTFRVGFNAWEIAKQRGLDYRDHSKLTPKQYPDGIALEYVNFEIKPQKHL